MKMFVPPLTMQYFLYNTLAHKDAGSRNILQPNFAMDAELSSRMGRIPNPPLGWV